MGQAYNCGRTMTPVGEGTPMTSGLWIKKISVRPRHGRSAVFVEGWSGEDPIRYPVSAYHGEYSTTDLAIAAAKDELSRVPNDVREVGVFDGKIPRSIPITES
jgi:hypothetical protein